ncbi:Transcriptional activator hac1 [Pleurostoma richardsiae]|uniref:Transcriptional activator hac1 n=1 Tax=Pleurostoma richardsiae TaxID=41990 RepID=A0AA38VH13_9PEZI|nr:Transcriptional activator hac1 [Pleurostoma richardsiae]
MDSWKSETMSPDPKFEDSPAESFLSAPGDMYPSLFGTPSSTAMDPLEIRTPQSLIDDQGSDLSVLTSLPLSQNSTTEQSSTFEKKSAKKRKSWGQVLPEPKTHLPPRKRAKTEDEKEQRRVERVLRNRRAAQSSRERKRLEVEALEQRNKLLEAALLQARKTNVMLVEELSRFRRNSGVATSSFDSFRPDPVTLSQQLFSSQDSHRPLEQDKSSLMDELLISTQRSDTVNPASLSPALTAVPEESDADDVDSAFTAAASAAAVRARVAEDSPDVTQHPAEVLCVDLQSPPVVEYNIGDPFCLPAAIDADSYVLESGLLSSPNSGDFEYDHMASDSAFPFPAASTNNLELFDINDFLNNDEATVASASSGGGRSAKVQPPTLNEPEAQVSPKDPSLQPRPGASTYGCDDGGIAVGVI